MVENKDYEATKLSGTTSDKEKITFAFNKAFSGTRVDVFNKNKITMTNDIDEGVYVKLTVQVATKKYDQIRLIQLVRNYTKKDTTNIAIDPEDDMHRGRCDWKNNKTGGTAGWRVDQLNTDITPWLLEDINTVKIGKNETTLWDGPAYIAPSPNKGKEFITAAIGYSKGKVPVYLGSVKWGFYVDGKENVSFDPAEPKFMENVPPELGISLARWNTFLVAITNRPNLLEPGYSLIGEIGGVEIPK
jgi:hypothetical protein